MCRVMVSYVCGCSSIVNVPCYHQVGTEAGECLWLFYVNVRQSSGAPQQHQQAIGYLMDQGLDVSERKCHTGWRSRMIRSIECSIGVHHVWKEIIRVKVRWHLCSSGEKGGWLARFCAKDSTMVAADSNGAKHATSWRWLHWCSSKFALNVYLSLPMLTYIHGVNRDIVEIYLCFQCCYTMTLYTMANLFSQHYCLLSLQSISCKRRHGTATSPHGR